MSKLDEQIEPNEESICIEPFASTSTPNKNEIRMWNNSNRRAWVKFSPDELKEVDIIPNSIEKLVAISPMKSNRFECSECKNLLLLKKDISICSNCIFKLYSLKICSICKGRISFNDLTENESVKIVYNGIDNQFNRKLCNCFFKNYPLSGNSILSNEVTDINLFEISSEFDYSQIFQDLTFITPTFLPSINPSNTYFLSIDDFSKE